MRASGCIAALTALRTPPTVRRESESSKSTYTGVNGVPLIYSKGVFSPRSSREFISSIAPRFLSLPDHLPPHLLRLRKSTNISLSSSRRDSSRTISSSPSACSVEEAAKSARSTKPALSSLFAARIAFISSIAALVSRKLPRTTDITVSTLPSFGMRSNFNRGTLRTGMDADTVLITKYSIGFNAVKNTIKNTQAESAAPFMSTAAVQDAAKSSANTTAPNTDALLSAPSETFLPFSSRYTFLRLSKRSSPKCTPRSPARRMIFSAQYFSDILQ